MKYFMRNKKFILIGKGKLIVLYLIYFMIVITREKYKFYNMILNIHLSYKVSNCTFQS